MSIEVTLYPKAATKTALSKFLETEGFQKVRHIFDGMNTPEYIHYMWFSFENYESSVGVEATIQKATNENKVKYNCSEWILHTRTKSSGSYEDKKKQNDFIRKARQRFKGTFYNDWYGTNKYTNLNHYDKFTPLEKGISIVSKNSLKKLEQIKYCLVDFKNELSDTISNIKPESLRYILIENDPSIILYNSLMPFLVSVLEYFYGQCFMNFIKYDEIAQSQLIDEKIKLGIPDVLKILQKENSIEQVISQSYNFQNLESINKAYKKYLSIDVLSILSKKKKINRNIFRISKKFQEILETRHRFVHELDIDYNMTKEIYLDYIGIVESAINLTVTAFKSKGLKLENDK